MPDRYHRFGPSAGWLTHLWKSTTRQDHAAWRAPLARLLPADGVAIDVGAHGGQVTRLLAGLVPRGLVVAVEPSGYARSILRPALWARGVRNVVVAAMALGAEPGVAMLRTPVKRRGDVGYGLASLAGGPAESVVEAVAVMTLDGLVAALGLDRVDFIKADIEGHEAALVAGGRQTLLRHRPALLLEQDSAHLARAGASLEGLWAVLTGLGYRPHVLAGEQPSPVADGPAQGDILWLPA